MQSSGCSDAPSGIPTIASFRKLWPQLPSLYSWAHVCEAFPCTGTSLQMQVRGGTMRWPAHSLPLCLLASHTWHAKDTQVSKWHKVTSGSGMRGFLDSGVTKCCTDHGGFCACTLTWTRATIIDDMFVTVSWLFAYVLMTVLANYCETRLASQHVPAIHHRAIVLAQAWMSLRFTQVRAVRRIFPHGRFRAAAHVSGSSYAYKPHLVRVTCLCSDAWLVRPTLP